MERVSIRSVASLVAVMAVIVVSTAGASTLGPAPVLVTIGSPVSPFSQNKQNEPAVAVDPASSNVLVAGSNDNIDMELCKAGDPTTCPFTPGVGSSGVYFSFDSGASWTQPTYSGWSARGCTGPAECTPAVGPIGTLPGYFPAGLVSDGDPSVAFGPQPGRARWLQLRERSAPLLREPRVQLREHQVPTRHSTAWRTSPSRTPTNLQAAASGSAAAWSAPALVGKQNSALFNDKDTVWADNSATSRFFGRVYVCNTSFRGQEKGNAAPGPILFYRSTDGGTTWSNPTQLSAATNNPSTGGRQDCAVPERQPRGRFAFWDGFVGSTGVGAIYQARSTDGGRLRSRPARSRRSRLAASLTRRTVLRASTAPPEPAPRPSRWPISPTAHQLGATPPTRSCSAIATARLRPRQARAEREGCRDLLDRRR